MKRLLYLLFLITAVACSKSPVEEYIENDFAKVVRKDEFSDEFSDELDRMNDSLCSIIDTFTTKVYSEEYNAAQQQLGVYESRYRKLKNYRLYNEYEVAEAWFWWGDYGNNYDGVKARFNSINKKVKDWKNQAIDNLSKLGDALRNVDTDSLLFAQELVKNDSISFKYLFAHTVGEPEMIVDPSEEELNDMAVSIISNYLIEHPTPTVKAYKYQENNKWYILLSNDRQFFLWATECENGEFAYQYSETSHPD